MVTGIKPTDKTTPGSTPTQPKVENKPAPVDSMSYAAAPKMQPTAAPVAMQLFVRTAETERERLKPIPPRLPIQPGPAAHVLTAVQLSEEHGGHGKKHVVTGKDGLTLMLRSESSVPCYWAFEGMASDPHVHQAQVDLPPPGTYGGASQVMHYTWSHAQLEKMGASFTLNAKFVHQTSGTVRELPFHIERR